MDVLVTGAAGMVGRAAVPVLRSAGHRVIATDLPGAADLGPLIRAGQPRGVAGWPYIDVRDLSEAVRLAVESDLPGHEAFYIAAPDTIGGIDLHASWRTANPRSATDLRPVSRPDASGINSGKAQRLLGWQATRSWRDYLTHSGEPR